MELRQLDYLVAVVDEGGFTRAAARLHVAQPGVSAQIRQLERELGEVLLDRTGRRVRPTGAGEAVLPYARAALAAVAGARHAVAELSGLVRGRVRVGTVASLASLDLPGLLAGFHRGHPEVEISLAEGPSGRLLEQLRAGELDLAFLGTAVDPPTAVATQVVADERLVAAVAPGDPLAARDEVTVAALRRRRLICLPRGAGLRACVDAACAAAGFDPHVVFEAGDPHVLARYAARGLGVALLPESVANRHAEELHVLTITRPSPRARILLAWRDEGPAGPAARALIADMRSRLPNL